SCEVRKPSKKCRNGMRDSSVAACAIKALSCASCTDAELSSANPVERGAATWNTVEVSSPAILNMLGSISSRPCEDVKVVVSAPDCNAPCAAPAPPASDCISCTRGTVPQRLV